MARSASHIDMRVIKTKRSIRSALAHLMTQRDISLISVSDVAHAAMVNKKTFLAHYASIYAVVEEMEGSALTSLKDTVGSADVIFDSERLGEVLCQIGAMASDTTSEFGCLLRSRVRDEFLSKMRVCISDKIGSDTIDSHIRASSKRVGYAIDFVSGGVVSIFSRWIDSGFKGSATDVASAMESFARSALIGYRSQLVK
jgi:AcrR family transcriptional regulator